MRSRGTAVYTWCSPGVAGEQREGLLPFSFGEGWAVMMMMMLMLQLWNRFVGGGNY